MMGAGFCGGIRKAIKISLWDVPAFIIALVIVGALFFVSSSIDLSCPICSKALPTLKAQKH